MFNPNLHQDFTNNCLNLFYDLGIRVVFAIPGAHIEHFILAIAKDHRFQLIVAAHEEGAGFCADGYFRKSHQIPIVATINGPGATNLLTAVSTSQVDHSSVLYITGDTAFALKDKLAFQTSSQLNDYTNVMFKSIVNRQIIPIEFNDLYQEMMIYHHDFKLSKYYPLHINLHNDISKSPMSEYKEVIITPIYSKESFSFNLNQSVVVFGEDFNQKDEICCVVEYCTNHRIPMVCTLGSKNVQALIPKDLFCGVYGYAGHSCAIELIHSDKVERVYFLNTELNERNTMAWNSKLFKKNREIIVVSPNLYQHGINEFDIKSFECSMEMFIQSCHLNDVNHDWFQDYIYTPKSIEINEVKPLDMTSSVLIMNQLIDKASNFVLDSGDHRIYGSLYWDVSQFNTFFTASKTAPMGWAIGAGIGVSLADTSNATWVLTGDGCMLMHGNEMAVAQRYHSNVKYVVINNGSYGRIEYRLINEEESVKQQISRLPTTSWVNYANSFNIPACCVYTNQELADAIKIAQDIQGPYLIEIMIQIENGHDIKSIFSSTARNFTPFWKVEKTDE